MAEAIRWTLIVLMLICIAVILAACSGPVAPPSTLKPAPNWCMAGPSKLQSLAPGENLVEKHAQLRRQYKNEAAKTRCLQRYVKTVRG